MRCLFKFGGPWVETISRVVTPTWTIAKIIFEMFGNFRRCLEVKMESAGCNVNAKLREFRGI